MARNKTKSRITKLGKEMSAIRTGVSRQLNDILDNLQSGLYSESSASLKTLMEVGTRLESLGVKDTLTDVIYEMLQLLATIDWNEVLWKEVDGKPTPRVILSVSYYDEDLKNSNYYLWSHTYIDGIASESDFLERFILPYLPNIDKCKELVGKAKKGTLVYTDISLASKFEDAPKVNLHQRPETLKDEDVDKDVNVNALSHNPDSRDYIFGRLKRDVELGDKRAIEVSQKVRKGEYTSARQVALEMGYRKPVQQKCLPKDTRKAVEKIVRELGEDYLIELKDAIDNYLS